MATAFTPAEIAAGDADPDADFDGDDLLNLAEMALGTNPTLADAYSIIGTGNLSGLELVEESENRFIIRDKRPITPGSPRFIRIVISTP
ncbi:MAG: hypothetical protein ACI8Z5_001915 [Lentimonas sp.]